MNKYIRFFLLVLLCVAVSGLNISAVAENSFEIIESGTWGNLNWTLNGCGLLTITGEGDMDSFYEGGLENDRRAWREYKDQINDVLIWEGVTSIGNYAFNSCHNIQSVYIPKGLTRIGDLSFGACENLVGIVIPDSVELIAQRAFLGCSSLQVVILPNGLKEIGEMTFKGCESMQSITLPDSLQTIRNGAFENCGLIFAVIPEGAKRVEDFAFADCNKMMRVNVPNSVDYIGQLAFYGCTQLTSIVCRENSYAYSYFSGFGVKIKPVLYDESYNGVGLFTRKTIDWTYQELDANTAEINGYNRISEFSNVVVIPQTIEGYNVTRIGKNLISNYNTWPRGIVVPEGVTHLDDQAFATSGIACIVLPDSLTSIGDAAFTGNNTILNIMIPKNVVHIGTAPFANTRIRVFAVSPENPYYGVIDGSLFSKEDGKLICYPKALGLSEYSVPQGIEIIGDGAFLECSALESVMLPDSVRIIEKRAFMGCYNLKNVIIQEGVERIETSAFVACRSLTSIKIPESLTYIGKRAFRSCEELKEIVIPAGVTCIEEDAFSGCDDLVISVYPGSYAEQYCKENELTYVYVE